MSDRPIVLLVADSLLPTIEQEFRARYDRDYRIELAGDAETALTMVRGFVERGESIAMIAAHVRVGHTLGWELLRDTQPLSPTSRRVVLVTPGAEWASHLDVLREAILRRYIDTFVGVPLGPRDEEFHTAIIELLSEWGWSVASPTVTAIEIVAEPHDREANAIRDLLERLGFPNRLLAPDSVDGAALLSELKLSLDEPVRFPLVRVYDGRLVNGATAAAINQQIYGRLDDIPSGEVTDLLVIGAGPAGLASAVYAASEGLSTVVLERDAIGGQAGSSSMIRNYLGFPRGISGMRLAQRSRIQASRFGARFYTGRTVASIEQCTADGAAGYRVRVGESEVIARTVLLSTGVAYRRLALPSVDAFAGAGVHYGAATSTARELQGRRAVVVGGGNSAGQAAVHLAKFATHVTILIRRASLSETMSDYLIREIEATPNITLLANSEISDGGGQVRLEWIRITSTAGGTEQELPVDGLFCMLGARPDCSWLPDDIALDAQGYVLTGRDVPRESWTDGMPPADLETTLPGVFAAGDVRSGSMKRVASASGEGASVMPLVHAHLTALRAQEYGASA
ncbi:FAD-dependent oxidoreductase [Leucobacter sp. NPDC058333]|uniref:FAD-dependent oxidoreductase n=1 Tax=Leucobacter sp. NPDC058333 TaxID=3346450 RepID=UPI0036663F9F